MNEQELFHLLALQKVDGVGDIMAKKLINHCGNAEAIFKNKSSHLAKIDGVGAILLKNLKNKTIFESAQKELQFIESNQIQTLYFQDGTGVHGTIE